MLALEIEYLTGAVVAKQSENQQAVDFPPQPDRVFSALVASWGARGESGEERRSLEWLECQNPPRILWRGASPRSIVTTFVPPNDFKTTVSGSLDVIPDYRKQRQPRTFPTAGVRPIENNGQNVAIRMIWEDEPDDQIRSMLDALAHDTAYIGHSSSLTRCRFVSGTFDLSDAKLPLRIVYEGRLRELEAAFVAGRRPQAGAVNPFIPVEDSAPRTTFSSDWIVLEDDGGQAPDILGVSLVARALRDALMEKYQQVFSSRPPEWLCGHRSDGSPSQLPHTAIIPLADVGWQHSQGRIVGLAIVPPRSLPQEIVRNELWQLVGALNEIRGNGERQVHLHYGENKRNCWQLMPADDPHRASLRSDRWISVFDKDTRRRLPARLWTTATPLVLDRFPQKNALPMERDAQFADSIASACENIGLPRPIFVSYGAVSALRGAAAASTSQSALPWQKWQLPRSLERRYLVHATIGFDEGVEGPVILGAGRYVGMGLCLAVPQEVKP